MDVIIHLIARGLPSQKPLADPLTAWWLMRRLRIAFPEALAACVMPDHVHLLAHVTTAASARRRLSKILAVATVRSGSTRLFESVPEPQPLSPGKHLERSVRYLHLNPCRAGLVSDPLAWPWSTHRGLIGAEVDPWVTPTALASAVGRPARGLSEWLHRYVSSDPAVSVDGTPIPQPARASDLPSVPLSALHAAALSATPWSRTCVRRRFFVELALHQGWRDLQLLARAVGCSGRSVRRMAAEARDPPLALRVCAGDRRLVLPASMLHPTALRAARASGRRPLPARAA